MRTAVARRVAGIGLVGSLVLAAVAGCTRSPAGQPPATLSAAPSPGSGTPASTPRTSTLLSPTPTRTSADVEQLPLTALSLPPGMSMARRQGAVATDALRYVRALPDVHGYLDGIVRSRGRDVAGVRLYRRTTDGDDHGLARLLVTDPSARPAPVTTKVIGGRSVYRRPLGPRAETVAWSQGRFTVAMSFSPAVLDVLVLWVMRGLGLEPLPASTVTLPDGWSMRPLTGQQAVLARDQAVALGAPLQAYLLAPLLHGGEHVGQVTVLRLLPEYGTAKRASQAFDVFVRSLTGRVRTRSTVALSGQQVVVLTEAAGGGRGLDFLTWRSGKDLVALTTRHGLVDLRPVAAYILAHGGG